MIADDFFFTLPDNVDLKKIKTNIITKEIYLFLFFLFRWFIFEEYFNIFKRNFCFIYFNIYGNCLYFKQNQNFNLKFIYIYFFFIFKFKLFDLLLINNKISSLIKLKDNNLLINLFLLNKSLNLVKFKFDFFYLKNKFKIFLFSEFKLRLPLFLFIGYKKYMQFFRYYKYNEYLNYNPFLYKYPLLKYILHQNWRGRKKRLNIVYFNQEITNACFIIYYATFEKYFISLKNFNLNWLTILLFLDKFKFIKFVLLINKKLFKLLLLYFKIYFLNILFLFLYKFWLTYFIERYLDATFAYKWRIYYMLHLHWWLNKYITDLPVWLYMLLIIYLIKIFLSQYIYIYNFSTLLNLKNKENFLLSFNNLCLFKITNLIFTSYIDIMYYKYYKLLITRNYGSLRVFNLWEIYFRNYVFEFTDLSFFYDESDKYLIDYFLNFKYSFDYIYWKVFFISNFINNKMLKFNIFALFNKTKIDTCNSTYFNLFLENIVSIIEYTFRNKVYFYNIYYIYIFIRDLFIKHLIKSLSFQKILISSIFDKNIRKNYIFFQFKYYLWIHKSILGYFYFNQYYLKNKKLYKYSYDPLFIYMLYICLFYNA